MESHSKHSKVLEARKNSAQIFGQKTPTVINLEEDSANDGFKPEECLIYIYQDQVKVSQKIVKSRRRMFLVRKVLSNLPHSLSRRNRIRINKELGKIMKNI